jgi:hypothetical protein
MSPIIRFAHDDSLWRFVGTMECDWQDISSQSPYRQHRHPWPKHHYTIIKKKDGTYNFGWPPDVTLEIDAVRGIERGSMFNTAQETLTTVVYLDSALVGLTRATTGRFGDAMSGFTYVWIRCSYSPQDVLLGISTPGFDGWQWEPVVEVWAPPRPLSSQEPHPGLGFPWGEDGSALERLSKSHSLTVEGKIPGENSTWLEKMQTVSKYGDTEDANLLACDGELLAAPWHGNPRDIRRRILGLPEDPEGWCPAPKLFFGKDAEAGYR